MESRFFIVAAVGENGLRGGYFEHKVLFARAKVHAARAPRPLGERLLTPPSPSAQSDMSNVLCPASAPFFGFMGAAVALIFASACTPPWHESSA